jgi:hypothetical protein
MIGLLAKLAKAAKLAQTAGAAIDVASNRIAPDRASASGSAGDGAQATPPAAAGDVPDAYRAMLDAGARDARELLSSADASRISGKPTRKIALGGADGYLMCDYHCDERANTILGLHVSATIPWEQLDTQITKREVFDDVGDAAFRGARKIYVRAGDTVFWINTAGDVTIGMALEAARLVVGRLQPTGQASGEPWRPGGLVGVGERGRAYYSGDLTR